MSLLPAQIQVLERGWLSSNNILFLEGERAALMDSGYVTQAEQTLALVRHALDGRRLTRLFNTHSHSDHIGGNATLAREFGCAIAIPAGIEAAVADWDEHALMLSRSAQSAERFAHDDIISDGAVLDLGGLTWHALAAPGHDMHALIYHCPDKRILISGDALWRVGFGVIFAEVMGIPDGLKAARATLESIARLSVDVVIPGHGAPFVEVDDALDRAFKRLAAFEADGPSLGRHALKVLFSFLLMERRRMAYSELLDFCSNVELCRHINQRYLNLTPEQLAEWLVRDLQRSFVLKRNGDEVVAVS